MAKCTAILLDAKSRPDWNEQRFSVSDAKINVDMFT